MPFHQALDPREKRLLSYPGCYRRTRRASLGFSLNSDRALSSKARWADDRFRVPTMRALALRALLLAPHLVINLKSANPVVPSSSGLGINAFWLSALFSRCVCIADCPGLVETRVSGVPTDPSTGSGRTVHIEQYSIGPLEQRLRYLSPNGFGDCASFLSRKAAIRI